MGQSAELDECYSRITAMRAEIFRQQRALESQAATVRAAHAVASHLGCSGHNCEFARRHQTREAGECTCLSCNMLLASALSRLVTAVDQHSRDTHDNSANL